MAESKPKKPTEKSKNTKVFDVAHPSKTVASTTSKPVIVGHTNMIKKDPMVAPIEQTSQEELPEEKVTIMDKPKRELKLTPVSEQPEVNEPQVQESFDAPSEDEVVAESPAEESEPNSSDSVQEDVVEDVVVESEVEESQSSEGEMAVDAIVAGVNTKKERKDQEAKEAKLAEEIQGLIASKKFYVKTHLPPGKRNLRWTIILIVLLLVAAGWYFGVGPGKKLWSKSTEPATAVVVASSPTPKDTNQTETAPPQDELVEFKNEELGISFSHPKDWEVEVTEGIESPLEPFLSPATYTAITLNSPVTNVQAAGIGEVKGVEVEVFLQTKIFIEKDVPADKVAKYNVRFASCSTEDIIISNKRLSLAFVDETKAEPNIETVTISSSDCRSIDDGAFSLPILFQLTENKNMYTIKSKLVFSEKYLGENGVTDEEGIKLAQSEGVLVAKDTFKENEYYDSLIELLKSIKEL